ncbi:hypothetical protein TNCT_297131 [Trichonephila clavata]|uniref:Uncharacterized protein n=1 Tax=Trichonephila clavata TaxID=2740835 RepID=A0A8X6F743_TRICU|nr:hypothetical protein TNCT_297131 [Trichonephila clavata]
MEYHSMEMPMSKNILDCRLLLQSLRLERRQIPLHWIPGHSNIYGKGWVELCWIRREHKLFNNQFDNSFQSSKSYEVKLESTAHFLCLLKGIGGTAWTEISLKNALKNL